MRVSYVCVALALGMGCSTVTGTDAGVVKTVSVSLSTTEIAVGSKVTPTLSVDATNAPKSVQWSSSDPASASVDGVTGMVTGIAPARGITICAVSTFDSTRRGCVSVNVYSSRTVRYWLRIPATTNDLPGLGKARLKYGDAITYKSYGEGFTATLDTLKYTSGAAIPSDMDVGFCLFLLGQCDLTASLIINYYSADITNKLAVPVYVQVRRPSFNADPVYTCIASFQPNTTGSLPYYESFFGNPYAGELRIFTGSGCTGPYYDVTVSGNNYSTNPSGFVAINVTTAP